MTICVLVICAPNPLSAALQHTLYFGSEHTHTATQPIGSLLVVSSSKNNIQRPALRLGEGGSHVAASPSIVAVTQREYLQAESPLRAYTVAVNCRETRIAQRMRVQGRQKAISLPVVVVDCEKEDG